MKKSTWYRDLLVMLAALCVAGVAVVWVQRITGRIDGVAMLIFMLAVFVTSMYTDGYLWGVLASLASVLAVNFAFFTPYFAFNFTLPENLFSGLVMLVVSIMTSTLTTRIKKQEQLWNPILNWANREINAKYITTRDLNVPEQDPYSLSNLKNFMENLSDKELAAFRNRKLGFVFQSFHLINSLNVLDNVELPLLYRKVSAKERRRLAEEVLQKVGLSHLPTQLSGGQCQRVAIARAIIGNPEIILADEPTGNLDSKMGAEVMELLHRLNKEDGRTIVMVTHNEEQARQTSRTIRFFDGRQVE